MSALLHLLGAGVFAVLSIFLLGRGRGRPGRVISLGVFCFACVFMLSMSGVYHLLTPGGAGHAVLQRLDHAAIFILIAGTFTPVHWILFTGWWRWGMLAFIWAVAITGLTVKIVFFVDIPEWLGLVFYLSLGWLGVMSGIALYCKRGLEFIKPLLWGGVSYSLGAVIDFLRFPVLIPGVVGPHELFHVGVLMGIGFHWWFIYCSVTDGMPRERQPT